MRLFDTDVLIEHLRGNSTATALVLEAVRRNQAGCSALSRFEILAGMRTGERSAVRLLFSGMVDCDITAEVANRAGEWARLFRKSHAEISVVDYLIAATAEVYGADLLTRNVRHFPMFPDLEPAF